MLVKKLKDFVINQTLTCGEIREVIRGNDYDPLGLAIAIDIKPTQAHYHKTFDEIYFVLDGEILIKCFDPNGDKIWIERLIANELIVITKGIHHRVIEASNKNRLCVISVPPFHADDEHPSDKI